MGYFIRVNARPRRDLDRGFSYSMGCFGDESEAHAGLSGYSLDLGVGQAVSDLHERMGVSGCFTSQRGHRRVRGDRVMYVTIFEGRDVGTGPDGEELFRPTRIVASWKTREIASVADLLERLAAMGIADEEVV